MMFNGMKFANPEFFYLFALMPLLILWYIFKHRKANTSLKTSTAFVFKDMKTSLKVRLRHLPFLLRLLAFSFIIIVLARPQSTSTSKSIQSEGIDIVMALDLSTSMLAEDLRPNRLEAAKKYAAQFVESRTNDRIGLVTFAAESFTQCPITIDHSVLKNLLSTLKTGLLQDGTAIGSGLATAVTRLKDSKAKSRVVILLTDGINNSGFVAPQTAAEIAQSFGIRVYTIAVGTRGMARMPYDTPIGKQYAQVEVKIDEDVLKGIAKQTGGEYFRATDNKSLEKIYEKIDKMEKIKVDVSFFTKHSELYLQFAFYALLAFALEILLRYTYLRQLP